jgi:type III secretion protein V
MNSPSVAMKRQDKRRLSRFIDSTDVALIALVVAILALIVLPLPVFLLDLLIGVNIAMSIMLLMLAVYVPSTLALSTFPSLLLFTTMLRLALSIAATKHILLTGQAGAIIETFGRLVVGGNVLIGFVVFTVIAIVQFIVVAKGSERVAEVGARFTLDAMPGKQMSIDADLRAGIITKETARARRAELEKSSQFHGAMDGAMKFVKNDAICGLIIAFVNIVAGVGVGVLYRDMTVVESLNRFTLLTVGEGLVAQIPSLLVSIAAGVIVTRESGSGGKPSNLGRDIGKQFMSQPVALMFTGVIILAFLAIPGFPKIQFAFLGLTALGLSLLLKRHLAKPEFSEQTPMPSMRREGRLEVPQFVDDEVSTMTVPVTVLWGPESLEAINAPGLDDAIAACRVRVRRHLGLPFPGMTTQRSSLVPRLGFTVQVHDVPAVQGVLRPGKLRIADTVEKDKVADLVLPADDAFPGQRWVDETRKPTLVQRGIEFSTNEDVVAEAIEWSLLKHADSFLGIQEAQQLLNEAESHYPELAQEALRALPLQRIAEALRRLVQEGISIRYLREILESLVTWGPREKDIVMLVEYIRVDLGKFTSHHLSKGTGRLRAIVPDSTIEQQIRDAIQPGQGGSFIAMEPEQVTAITQALKAGMEYVAHRGEVPIFACSIDVRRYVRRMLEQTQQKVTVVSFQEVGNHALIEPIHRVSLPSHESDNPYSTANFSSQELADAT